MNPSLANQPAYAPENWRRRPLALLVQLFAARMFYGDADSEDDLGMGMGVVLALLALPGGFVSILLADKYGSLLQFLRGQKNFDPYAASLPDEYFFIVLSMFVTGTVVVWKWESIFPGRRDYMNLVPLPLRMRTIFFANLLALLLVTGGLALDVNAASSVLFPFVVSASQDTFHYFFRFMGAHAVSVVLASIFAFLAVFSTLGLSMAILPYSVFRRAAPYIRAAIIVCLLTLLATSFAVPPMLQALAHTPHAPIRLLPSVWFLGLSQWLLGRVPTVFAPLALSAISALGVATLFALAVYGASYRRYFTRIPEMTEITRTHGKSGVAWPGALLDQIVLRSPFQRACVRFVWKTTFRSERHVLAIASFAGLGLVLASQALLSAFRNPVGARATSADALSIPFIFAFCIIVGLRLGFEIPVELRANWIFQLLLDRKKHESQAVAKRTILLCVVPSTLLLFPVYAYLAGWIVALLHTSLVVLWSLLLTDALLLRFRKLPFTCSFPMFRQHAIPALMLGGLGFLGFAVWTSEVEHWGLSDPVQMLVLVFPAAIAWYLIRRVRKEAAEIDQQLIFEEAPGTGLEILQLGEFS